MAGKGAAGGVIKPIMEGLFGGNTDQEDQAAQEYINRAINDGSNVAAPEFNNLTFEGYQNQGDLALPGKITAPVLGAGPNVDWSNVDPRMANVDLVGRTSFNDVNADPRLKEDQAAQLAVLRQLAANGGMTATDTANLSRVQNQAASADRGRREAILQSMQARGMGGSGQELLAQLSSSQAATDSQSQRGLDIAGMAQQRALDATMQAGQLAGSQRTQDFSEQAQKAAARDEIARFNAANTNSNNQFNTSATNNFAMTNAQNKMGAQRYNADALRDTQARNADLAMRGQQFNADAANKGAEANWQSKQQVANANVDTRNKQTMFNGYQLPQSQFDASVKQAALKQGANAMGADYWTKRGDREANEAAGYFGGATKLGAAGIAASDKRAKTAIKPISDADLDEFMAAYSPKAFKYKDDAKSGTAGGDRVGFVAQDVADTKLGKKLIRQMDDGTLAYDKDNLNGIMMAVLKRTAKEGK